MKSINEVMDYKIPDLKLGIVYDAMLFASNSPSTSKEPTKT